MTVASCTSWASALQLSVNDWGLPKVVEEAESSKTLEKLNDDSHELKQQKREFIQENRG
ncbi:hypothetical protein E8E14_000244 [Neopestalotiopsis sp. 37M]|nr:hypothetical protein E8E14_000244 [Neopestalotiopsis sp. 37M]